MSRVNSGTMTSIWYIVAPMRMEKKNMPSHSAASLMVIFIRNSPIDVFKNVVIYKNKNAEPTV
ncbi:MAG: hypothetical protein V4642_03430 [Bacteroidota bacterium]